MSKFKLADLPPAAREQATRQVSRDLARGNGPAPTPGKPIGTQSVHGPTVEWFKAAWCNQPIVPVQVVKVTSDRLVVDPAEGPLQTVLRVENRVRYFPDRRAAREWVDGTYRDEIDRLSKERGEFIARESRHDAAANQIAEP